MCYFLVGGGHIKQIVDEILVRSTDDKGKASPEPRQAPLPPAQPPPLPPLPPAQPPAPQAPQP